MIETAGHSAAATACVEHGLAAGRNASTLLPAANTLHSTTAGPLWKTNADGTPKTGSRLPSWTLQNPYTFKAGLQDRATCWVKYGQRWYNAGTGRWTQMETLDAPLDPANANRYAYAANDSTNNSDPTGMASIGCAPMNTPGCLGGGVYVAPLNDPRDTFTCRLSVASTFFAPMGLGITGLAAKIFTLGTSAAGIAGPYP